LDLLAIRISEFFKDKDFEAVKGKVKNGYQILASDSPFYKLNGCVSVIIEGDSNGFSISFNLDVEKEDFRISPFLMSFFGGGYLFLRRIRAKEDSFKLEKDFWRYVEKVVLRGI